MKKYISYILLAVFAFNICLVGVNAIEIDNNKIVLPDKLEKSSAVQFNTGDATSGYFQVLNITNDKELIEAYNDYDDATDEDTKDAYLTSLEEELNDVIQEDSWVKIEDELMNLDFELEAGKVYLAIVKATSSTDDTAEPIYGVKVYGIASDVKENTTENKDTGINDTLLIIGVPVLLIAGVYLTTKKQYN